MILSSKGHICAWAEVASRNSPASFRVRHVQILFIEAGIISPAQSCLVPSGSCEVPVWWHKNTSKRPRSWRRCCRSSWDWCGASCGGDLPGSQWPLKWEHHLSIYMEDLWMIHGWIFPWFSTEGAMSWTKPMQWNHVLRLQLAKSFDAIEVSG